MSRSACPVAMASFRAARQRSPETSAAAQCAADVSKARRSAKGDQAATGRTSVLPVLLLGLWLGTLMLGVAAFGWGT